MKPIVCLATALILSTAAILPTQAVAQVRVDINLGNAPPPVRYEAVPAARRGYVWAPGYWNWNGKRHVWTAGHWEPARTGQVYEPAEWRQDGDKWKFKRGEWKRTQHDNGVGHKDKHDDKHDDKHRDFCPPGQAKKGNC